MSIFNIIALLLTLAAIFSFLNYRYLRLPTTIGLMLLSMGFSLFLIFLSYIGIDLESSADQVVRQIDFDETLLNGMLSFLLFAGALHINLEDLVRRKWTIGGLATFGVLLSTFIVGCSMYYLLGLLGLTISFLHCLIFGSLISPTDPIAVLGLLKQAKVSKSLEVKIAGKGFLCE